MSITQDYRFHFPDGDKARRVFWKVSPTHVMFYTTDPRVWAFIEKEVKTVPTAVYYYQRSISAKQFLVTKEQAETLEKRSFEEILGLSK